MKTSVRNAVAALVVLSMSLPFASCTKKTPAGESGSEEASRSGEKIASESPWYSNEVTEVIPAINMNREIESYYSQCAGSDDNYIVVMTNGYYKIPDDFNWENFNNSDFAIYTATVIDRATKQTVNTIDLNDILKGADYIDYVRYMDGKISALGVFYDPTTDVASYLEVSVDPATGSVLDARDVEGHSIEQTYNIGSYRIETELMWDEVSYYNLMINAPDGSQKVAKIEDPGKGIYGIAIILPLTETTVLVPASGDSGRLFFEVDLTSGNVTAVDGQEYEWLELETIKSFFFADDGTAYYLTNAGIKSIDMNNKSVGMCFNFSWCSVRRSDLCDFVIADYSDDKILLCGETYNRTLYSSADNNTFKVVELTKAPNPHAGKTVLELYAPDGYVDDTVADAVIKYNDLSPDYFIEVTDRYNSDSYYDFSSSIDSEDDFESYYLNGNSKISNDLAIDIMNGEGPDILLNCGEYGQLNNPNYLADLSPYVADLDSSRYFTNIIDGARVDGKLYQLPVSYMINGIQTSPSYAGVSGTGFTTSEYEDFLYDVLNGDDVIPVGQAYYFARIFSSMSDKFISDGKADFTGPEFAALAGFVKNNVPESARSWSNSYYDAYNEDYIYGSEPMVAPVVDIVAATPVKGDKVVDGSDIAAYVTCGSMSDYIYTLAAGKDCTVILGLPSADGRGPMFTLDTSVAVSAQAENIDACGEFIKILLSDEVQLELAMNDDFVLSRDAFRQGAAKAVEYYNGDGGYDIFGYDELTGRPANNGMVFSDNNITDMENNIQNCSRIYAPDATINLILIEEMPAYFMGQKSLEDVIAIAQDRVQKVLDERG